jgi:hypothetical protein
LNNACHASLGKKKKKKKERKKEREKRLFMLRKTSTYHACI